MNLILDIGNSFIKIAVFENNKIVMKDVLDKLSVSELIIYLNDTKIKYLNLNKCILSTVDDTYNKIDDFLTRCMNLYIKLNHETKIPIKNLYQTPVTLGKDRLAGVVGANNIYLNSNVLIFDAGTAVTIDFINDKNEYIGGNISPGLQTRYKSLHKFTNKLPLLKVNSKFDKKIGVDTISAITAGVQKGLIYEIDSYINDFNEKYNNLKIVFTGGDVFFFENNLKNNIFAEPNLVFNGLNRILEYNA